MTVAASDDTPGGPRIALRRAGDRKVFPVSADCIVGRIKQADICIDDEAGISRKHARIRRDGATHLLLDLGSLNGTTLNGQLLASATPIDVGDIIVFDQQRFEVIPWMDIGTRRRAADADSATRIADPAEADDPALIRPALRVVDDEHQFLDAIDREWSAATPAEARPDTDTPALPVRRRSVYRVLSISAMLLLLIGLIGWLLR